MRFYYDFHIHTALSPCADDTMTPNNIINMALLKELQIIAVTDHNSCKNAGACLEAAKGTGLLVLPGMELETSEEIHVVCLLPDTGAADAFGSYIEGRLNKVKNRSDVFGHQYIMDGDDEITGEYENLLITSTSLDFDSLFTEIVSFGGCAIPAHVDRGSNSVLSNLGFIPSHLNIPCIEISKKCKPEFIPENNLGKYRVVGNSDAHYLQDIAERGSFLEFDKTPEIKDVLERLRNYGMDGMQY